MTCFFQAVTFVFFVTNPYRGGRFGEFSRNFCPEIECIYPYEPSAAGTAEREITACNDGSLFRSYWLAASYKKQHYYEQVAHFL